MSGASGALTYIVAPIRCVTVAQTFIFLSEPSHYSPSLIIITFPSKFHVLPSVGSFPIRLAQQPANL